jgi:hypothetical protein
MTKQSDCRKLMRYGKYCLQIEKIYCICCSYLCILYSDIFRTLLFKYFGLCLYASICSHFFLLRYGTIRHMIIGVHLHGLIWQRNASSWTQCFFSFCYRYVTQIETSRNTLYNFVLNFFVIFDWSISCFFFTFFLWTKCMDKLEYNLDDALVIRNPHE